MLDLVRLHNAAEKGDIKAVKALLAAGASSRLPLPPPEGGV